MSIDKIQYNSIVQFLNKVNDNNDTGQADKALFDKELKNAQLEDKTFFKVDNAGIHNTSKNLPMNNNYHVLSQVPSKYNSEQLHRNALNYMIDGKVPIFANQQDKTEFALVAAMMNMMTKGLDKLS